MILDLVRGAREFEHLRAIAATLLESGQRAPIVQRYHAQALIEQNHLFLAEAALRALVVDAARLGDGVEERDANGLLGRVFKQRYVGGRASERAQPDDLRGALRFYLDTYNAAPEVNLYHGINAVALLARATKDGVSIENAPAIAATAEKILAIVENRFQSGAAAAWDKATAVEANVALGRTGDALTWLMRYINAIADESNGLERADAFKFESTRRQLVEVWRLDSRTEPGSLLLPSLEGALLRARDGSVTREPADVRATQSAGQFEARHGTDGFYPLQWLRTGDKRAQRVARISNRDTDVTKGTGFVMRGEDLAERFRGELVLVTNSHVISGKREVLEDGRYAPLELARVDAHLDVLNQTLACRAIVWESPPWEEDTAVVALENGAAIAGDPYPVYSRPLPVGGSGRIFIIGYPEASSQIRLSFENNQLLEMNNRHLRYLYSDRTRELGQPAVRQ